MKDVGRRNEALTLYGIPDLEERLGQSHLKDRLVVTGSVLRRFFENMMLDSAQASAYLAPRVAHVIEDGIAFLRVAVQVTFNRWVVALLVGGDSSRSEIIIGFASLI